MKPAIVVVAAVFLHGAALRSEQPAKGVDDLSGSSFPALSGQATIGGTDGNSSNPRNSVSPQAAAFLKNDTKRGALEKAMETLPAATVRLRQLEKSYVALKLPWLKEMERDPDLEHRFIWVRSRLESPGGMSDKDREQAQKVETLLTAYGELQQFRNVAAEVAAQVFYFADATEKSDAKSRKALDDLRMRWLDLRYGADKALWDARKKLKVPAGNEPVFPMRPKFPSSGDLE